MNMDENSFVRDWRNGRQKGEDVVHKLSVSLEDLYNGCIRKVELEKNVICKECRGKDGKKRSFVECPTCQGSGLQAKINHLLPGTTQQALYACNICNGQGLCVDPKEQCMTCNGKKVVGEKKILEVNVDKGMADGQKITYSGEGNQEPGLEPGDIIIVLDEREHRLYTRSGSDLLLQLEIDLVDALCGIKKVVKTLDDRNLFITTIPGKVLKHGDFKWVFNEGMPRYKNPLVKGRMIIHFLVNDELPVNKFDPLESYVPARPVETIPDNIEVVLLMDMDPDYEFESEDSSDED